MRTYVILAVSAVMFPLRSAVAAEDCSPYQTVYDGVASRIEALKARPIPMPVYEGKYAVLKSEEDAAYRNLADCKLRVSKELDTAIMSDYLSKANVLSDAYNDFVTKDYEGAIMNYERYLWMETDKNSGNYAIARDGIVKPRILLSMAQMLKDDWASAFINAQEALRIDPENPSARLLSGLCYEHNGDYANALRDYSEGLERTNDPGLLMTFKSAIASATAEKDRAYASARELRETEFSKTATEERIRLKLSVDSYFLKIKNKYAKYGKDGAKRRFTKLWLTLSEYSFADENWKFVQGYLMELIVEEIK